jgi:hypothetical protein
MFCRLKSSRLDEPPAPAAPPAAVKVPETLAAAPACAAALEPALEVDELELTGETFEVDGGVEGGIGGVHVGQLVPPFLQLVAKAPVLARARSAAAMSRVALTVDPFRWWVGRTAPGGA